MIHSHINTCSTITTWEHLDINYNCIFYKSEWNTKYKYGSMLNCNTCSRNSHTQSINVIHSRWDSPQGSFECWYRWSTKILIQSIWHWNCLQSVGQFRSHPYWRLNRSLRIVCIAFGTYCHRLGRERGNGLLWPLRGQQIEWRFQNLGVGQRLPKWLKREREREGD